MAYTYILYSRQLDKYYIGHTETSPEARLVKHLTDHDGFTARVKDWEIVWTTFFATKSEAYALERRIKGWKSKQAIVKLITGA